MKSYRPDRYHILDCEKIRLIQAVKTLNEELNRPISSQDLREYFLLHPEEQPLLRQCLGQQLLKASRSWKTNVPSVFQVGIIGKYAYYASTDAVEWKKKFDDHVLNLSIQNELKLNMAEKAISLIDSPYEKFARNALAGFISEWTPALKNNSIEEIDDLAEAIDEAKKYASKKFIRWMPKKLISRRQAFRFLQNEATRRFGKFRAAHINYDRYLASWSWPQVNLFPKSSKLLYVPEQLLWIAQKVWPLSEDNPFLAEALLTCSRYGVLGLPKNF